MICCLYLIVMLRNPHHTIYIHSMIPMEELDGQVQLEIPGTIDLCTLKQMYQKLTITWSKDNVCAIKKQRCLATL